MSLLSNYLFHCTIVYMYHTACTIYNRLNSDGETAVVVDESLFEDLDDLDLEEDEAELES